jgi:hypothetical protein
MFVVPAGGAAPLPAIYENGSAVKAHLFLSLLT